MNEVQVTNPDVEVVTFVDDNEVVVSPPTNDVEVLVPFNYTFNVGSSVPEGGLAGQYLRKISDNDFEVAWQNQEYAEYIYNPDLPQSGAVYNDWQDLVDAINAKGNAPCTINFTKVGPQALPAGHYNLNNVKWRGVGTPPGTGPIVYLSDGFTLEYQQNWYLEYGVAVWSQSNSPIMTVPLGSNFRMDLITSAAASSNVEMLLIQGGNDTIHIFFVSDGGQLAGAGEAGYELVRVDGAGAIIPVVLSGVNAGVGENSFRGGSSCPMIRIINTLQQQSEPFPSHDNWDGFLVDQRGMPHLVGYDGSSSGLSSVHVQAAIDELAGQFDTLENNLEDLENVVDNIDTNPLRELQPIEVNRKFLRFTSHVANQNWSTPSVLPGFQNSCDIRARFRVTYPTGWDKSGDWYAELFTQTRDDIFGAFDNFEIAVLWSNGDWGRQEDKPYLFWEWTEQGESSEASFNVITDPNIKIGEWITVRVTQDFDTGTIKLWKEVAYSTIQTEDGKYWQELESAVGTEATSIANDSNEPITWPDGEPWAIGYRFTGDIAWVQAYDGIDENLIVDFNAETITPNVTSFTDATSHVWSTVDGIAYSEIPVAGDNITDTNGLWSVNGIEWGNITGTLSDQTDLQTILDSKKDKASNVTFITGPTTISAMGVYAIFNLTGTSFDVVLPDPEDFPGETLTIFNVPTGEARLVAASPGQIESGNHYNMTRNTQLTLVATQLPIMFGGTWTWGVVTKSGAMFDIPQWWNPNTGASDLTAGKVLATKNIAPLGLVPFWQDINDVLSGGGAPRDQLNILIGLEDRSKYAFLGGGPFGNYDTQAFQAPNPGDFADGGADIYNEFVPLWQGASNDVDQWTFQEIFTIEDNDAWGGDLIETAICWKGRNPVPFFEVTAADSAIENGSGNGYGEYPTIIYNEDQYNGEMFMLQRVRYTYNPATGEMTLYRPVTANETPDDTAFGIDWKIAHVREHQNPGSHPIAPTNPALYPLKIGKGSGRYLVSRVTVNSFDGTPYCDFNPVDNMIDENTVYDPVLDENWVSNSEAKIIDSEDFIQKWFFGDNDAISDATDVDMSAPDAGRKLVWNGEKFVLGGAPYLISSNEPVTAYLDSTIGSGDTGTWDDLQFREIGNAVYDEETEQWITTYTARGSVTWNNIGALLSNDSYNWTPHIDNPIIAEADNGGAEDSFIAQTVEGNVWRDSDGCALMFAEEKTGNTHRGVNLWKSSPNTLNDWTFFGRVLDKGSIGDWNELDSTSPTVIYDDDSNQLVMLFEGRSPTNEGSVGIAFSSDEGETFIANPSPILQPSGISGAWNQLSIVPDALIKTEDGRWILLAHGVDDQNNWTVGRFVTRDAPTDWDSDSFEEMSGNPFITDVDTLMNIGNSLNRGLWASWDKEVQTVLFHGPEGLGGSNVDLTPIENDINTLESQVLSINSNISTINNDIQTINNELLYTTNTNTLLHLIAGLNLETTSATGSMVDVSGLSPTHEALDGSSDLDLSGGVSIVPNTIPNTEALRGAVALVPTPPVGGAEFMGVKISNIMVSGGSGDQSTHILLVRGDANPVYGNIAITGNGITQWSTLNPDTPFIQTNLSDTNSIDVLLTLREPDPNVIGVIAQSLTNDINAQGATIEFDSIDWLWEYPVQAENVLYDNTGSDLVSEDVQEAIDEIVDLIPETILPTGAPFYTPPGEWFLLTYAVGTGYAASGNSSTAANSNGRGKLVPFFINSPTTIDAFALHTVGTNAGVGACIRLGIYADNNGRPGNVILDAGTQSINTNGVKTFTFSPITLQPGRYWAINATQSLDTSGGNPTFSSTAQSSPAFPETTPQASNNMFTFGIATEAGALTNNPSVSISRSTNVGIPNIWCRKA